MNKGIRTLGTARRGIALLVSTFCLALAATPLASPASATTTSATTTPATVTPARLTIAPTPHAYGTVALGADSASQSFAVTNTGQSDSSPVAVSLAGTDPADYTVDADISTA